jgi:multimeric flavodoxin WrbA
MNITILNGNPNPSNGAFDGYLGRLAETLTAQGHEARTLALRDMAIGQCSGCFGCWVKTPGECVIHDDAAAVCRALINADWAVFASPVTMGFTSALLKRAMDRLIPLIHPYGAVDRGEAHHLARYDRYPKVGLLLEPGDARVEDLAIIRDMFSRTALNMKSRLCFARTTADPVEEVTRAITERTARGRGYLAPRLGASQPGPAVTPPARMTLFNGSPRGKSGNTHILLTRFAEGFEAEGGQGNEMHHLMHSKDMADMRDAFSGAECVMLGFPLYTDHMPGVVMSFIEALAPLVGKKGNPPLGFLVQSGFPEALHSRYVERYLAGLAARLGSPYLGTIVKGGGEDVRHMSAEQNRKTFDAMRALGAGLAKSGRFDPESLAVVAGKERYSPLMMLAFRPLLRMRFATRFWDDQMKKNGVFERNFARPYLETGV